MSLKSFTARTPSKSNKAGYRTRGFFEPSIDAEQLLTPSCQLSTVKKEDYRLSGLIDSVSRANQVRSCAALRNTPIVTDHVPTLGIWDRGTSVTYFGYASPHDLCFRLPNVGQKPLPFPGALPAAGITVRTSETAGILTGPKCPIMMACHNYLVTYQIIIFGIYVYRRMAKYTTKFQIYSKERKDDSDR
jgi:hypothetical protein